jgi:plasmid maintenance system antidote protein VapI
MTPSQYLAACKTKLGHCSDYALAKKWEIDKGYISKLMRGQRPINAHVAFLIAITLERDPAMVLADIEAQQQQGKAGEFWKSFLLRARQVAAAMALTLVCLVSAGTGNDPGATGGAFKRRLRFA